MADVSHASLTADVDLHEPKGAASATDGQLYKANGAGGGAFVSPKKVIEQAIYDYNDLATQTTPISLVAADTQYELPNDGQGPFTNKTYAYSDVADLWDTTTDRFDFTGLNLGDTVDIRFDVEVTTSGQNVEADVFIELGVGGTPYQLPIIPYAPFKSAGTYQLVRWTSVYMGDLNTLDNGARVLAKSDSTGTTVKVNGWYIRPMRNVDIV